MSGLKEIRSIYDADKDVDLVVFTPEEFMAVLESGVAGRVLSRGCQILYDSLPFSRLLERHVEPVVSKPEMSEAEFAHAVNDFNFHNIWAMKKLLRGELWTAQMCVDCYLKSHLLKMIELYCA
ncbi:MAG: aminoglycoside 6-adenylyltransferase [Bacillota bacterium]|nr:aminoglycoside 6-adenylyltransferase [Bacillota bacterium]